MTKVYKILPYIALIVAMIFIYDLWFKNKSFNDQIKDLQHEKDSIGIIISNNDKTILNLSKKLKQANKTTSYLHNKLKQQQDETNHVSDIVYTLDEQQLDSTIRAYKHIKRK